MGAGAKAKTVTNLLILLSVLAAVVCPVLLKGKRNQGSLNEQINFK
jgi:hypothetical protein